MPTQLQSRLVALLALAPPTLAGSGRADLRRLDFTAHRLGKATGFVEDVRFERRATDERALKRAVTVLARGTRLDDSVPKRCLASDAELVAEGPDACPRRSVVGDGLFRGKVGSASVDGDLTLLNNRDEIISVIESNLGRFVTRTPVEGGKIVLEVDAGVTIRRVRLEVDRISRDGRRLCEDSALMSR